MRGQMVDTRLRYAISGHINLYWNNVFTLRGAGS